MLNGEVIRIDGAVRILRDSLRSITWRRSTCWTTPNAIRLPTISPTVPVTGQEVEENLNRISGVDEGFEPPTTGITIRAV